MHIFPGAYSNKQIDCMTNQFYAEIRTIKNLLVSEICKYSKNEFNC